MPASDADGRGTPLEANKDEAILTVQRAQERLKNGDYEGARKLLRISMRLYPTEEARMLQDTIERLESLKGSTASSASSSSEGVRQRRSTTPSTPTPEPEPSRPFTPEQAEGVQRLIRCEDYYEVLGVSKTADEVEIKRAYRKLALIYHPDKNSAPGAEEAFKVLCDAFGVLSDPAKRRQYDTFGRQDRFAASSSSTPRSSNMYGFHRRGMYEPHSPFGTDMPLDEVLAMLFGGRFPGQPPRRAYQTNTRTQTVHTAELNLMSLLPILLFVIIAMYMLPRQTQPSFSLQPIATYNVPRFTSHLNVPYYVDSSFGSQFEKDPTGLQQFEANVEAEYLRRLLRKCEQEQQMKQRDIKQAQRYGDAAQLEKAQTQPTPSCTAYTSLRAGPPKNAQATPRAST